MINVLVVNWNSGEALARCLASIASSDFPSYRVIIVDNASAASDYPYVASLQDKYRSFPFYFVRNSENSGYAGGNNAGLRYTIDHHFDGDLLVVNPDAEVQPNTLRLMASAATGDIGIVVPRVIGPTGKVLFDRIKLTGYSQRHVVASEAGRAQTDIAQGTCLLIRRCVVDSIGLFDERFFLYWEEVDLSLRARAAGYRLVAVNETSVRKGHNSPARLPTCFYYSVRNANLIRKIHPSQFSLVGYWFYTLRVGVLCLKLIGNARLFFEALTSVAQGFMDGLAGRYGARRQV